MFEVAWTHRGRQEPPASSGALGAAVLTPDVVLLESVALDPATGRERWAATGALVGIDGGSAVVVRRAGDRLTTIERRDLHTGAVTAEAVIAAADGTAQPLRSLNAALAVGAGRLVHAHLGRIRGYAIDSGREAWAIDMAGTTATLVPSGDALGVVGASELVVVGAADGIERWRAPIDDGAATPSPRGGFFVARDKRVLELDTGGAEVRSVSGRFAAAGGDLLVATDGGDIVVFDGRGHEVDRIKPAGAGDYVTAPGLCDGAVVYFRDQDSTVWWHAASGSERPVAKIEPKSGMADGKHATAGATLTEPPRCVGPLVLVQDWFVTAYRVPRS